MERSVGQQKKNIRHRSLMAESNYTRLTEEDGSRKDPFDVFVDAPNLTEISECFTKLCESKGITPFEDHTTFFETLKEQTLSNWKAKELWELIQKRANRKEYNKGKACTDIKVLIIGAGPCGLRTAIELAFLGAKVVVIEKRDRFTRNNVLYLWPYLITDLTNLGAKKLYGGFGAGDINHISIIKLQTILLKVALLLGVEIHHSVEFVKLDEKPKKEGWRANVNPKDHKVSKFEFNYILAADGRQHTLPGFTWKESARTLAIGITTNYVNRHSQRDACTKEIPGKSYIYDQDFFQGLKKANNIELENIVYYKDETHYFVMTAKKTSLLEKGVLKKDEADTNSLLAANNINNNKLEEYAYQAAHYATEEKLPTSDCAKNYKGKPDIAMFDFTSRKQAKQAVLSIEADGKVLILGVVGDSLKEPFWPEGTGCALGFLGVFDTVWMIRDIATGERTLEEALETRAVVYKLLSNTKQEDLSKDHAGYGIDPRTRYTSQEAKRKELYKPEEPRRVTIREPSTTDEEETRRRPVSEFIKRDREENKGRDRVNTTAFSFKRKKFEEEAKKRTWSNEKKDSLKKDKDKGSVKEKKSPSKEKIDDKKTDGKEEKRISEEKEKKERKELKAKEKKMKKEKKQEKKKAKQNMKKKSKNVETDKKKSNEAPDESSGRRPYSSRNNEPKTIAERKAMFEGDGDQSRQGKAHSLDRRERDIKFNEARSRFESPSQTEDYSPVRRGSSTDQGEDSKRKKKRGFWKTLRFWKRSRSDEEDTDGKDKEKTKKKKKKLKFVPKKLRKPKRGKKNKGKKKPRNKGNQPDGSGSYEVLSGSNTSVQESKGVSEGSGSVSSSTSNLAKKASLTSHKKAVNDIIQVDKNSGDEIDGLSSKKEEYNKMSDSEEKIPKRTKSERSGSILKRFRSKKRKKYNSLEMEVERPIGS
ncbi:uncharacterized protein [Apostichopus japonicus]|uniref:uncharacterized protein isoform X2 n=1 Tax=Stichopus japonicus TaxID=307972 RepID=UPI003AB15C13